MEQISNAHHRWIFTIPMVDMHGRDGREQEEEEERHLAEVQACAFGAEPCAEMKPAPTPNMSKGTCESTSSSRQQQLAAKSSSGVIGCEHRDDDTQRIERGRTTRVMTFSAKGKSHGDGR